MKIRRVYVRIDPSLGMNLVEVREALVANSRHPVSVEFPGYHAEKMPEGCRAWVRIEAFPIPNPKPELGLSHQNLIREVLESLGLSRKDIQVDLGLPSGTEPE